MNKKIYILIADYGFEDSTNIESIHQSAQTAELAKRELESKMQALKDTAPEYDPEDMSDERKESRAIYYKWQRENPGHDFNYCFVEECELLP